MLTSHRRSVGPRWAALLAPAGISLLLAAPARAQGYPPQAPNPGWGAPPQGAPPPGYAPQQGYPAGVPYQPPPYSQQYPQPNTSYGSSSSGDRGGVELGTLYALATAYGVGSGVWLDAELGVDDPGLQFLAPAILGVAAPVGVFFLDRPAMPRGMPAAISAGVAIGAGEGIGIASYQFVHADKGDAWGFKGFSRSVFIGSTVGGIGGFAVGATMEPSPKTSLLLGSSVLWGTVVGSMFGYGGSAAGSSFGDANDSASLGGLIGYNAGLLGAAALSTVYVPSYKSLTWMWIGFAAGVGLSTPVYLFYAGSEHDARRGLIFQGTAALLGLAAGGILTSDDIDLGVRNSDYASERAPAPIEVTSVGPMGVPGGFGVQVSGTLF